MRQGFIDRITLNRGYISSRNPFTIPDGAISSGSYNILFQGEGKPSPLKGVVNRASSTDYARQRFPVVGGAAGLGNYSTAGKGNVFNGPSKSVLYIGTGPVRLPGEVSAGTATTSLTMRLLSLGSYLTVPNSGPFTLGLSQPAAPTTTAMTPTGGAKAMTGSYSFRITRICSITGGESIASVQSTALSVSAQSIRMTFPAAENHQDAWGVYATLRDYSLGGPHYFYAEVTEESLTIIGGVARSFQVNFYDAELLDELAPVDFFPPPAAVFGYSLETVLGVIGCEGDIDSGITTSSPGTAIAISEPNYIESYPPQNRLYLPEEPTAVISRAADGYVLVFCRNSLHAITYTGSTPPCELQTLWPDLGIANHHNATMAEGTLYAFTSKRGAIRMGPDGKADTEFAAAVAEDMADWSTDTVVAYAPADQLVWFLNARKALCFNKQKGMWSAPVDLTETSVVPTGSVMAAHLGGGSSFSESGETLYITYVNGAMHSLFELNTPGGTVNWRAMSGWRDGGSPQFRKTIRTVRAALDRPAGTTLQSPNVKLFTDQNSSAVTVDYTADGSASPHTRPKKANAKNVESYAIAVSGTKSTTALQGPLEIVIEGVAKGLR